MCIHEVCRLIFFFFFFFFFFARMVFGTPYRGDFINRVHLHANTRRNSKQRFFNKYAEIDF